MRLSNRRWMKYGAAQQNADAIAALRGAAMVIIALSALILFFLLAGCASTPTQNVVSHAEALPPQKVAVSVLCVTESEIPPVPPTAFDPKAEFTEQLAAQAQADIDSLKIYANDLRAIAVGCASGQRKPEVKP